MAFDKPLQVGVLIIGSLFWDERRRAWRNCRPTHDVCDAAVRIRYGRRSASRGDSYTTVFSEQAGKGRAKIVRCHHMVSKTAHLVEEAEHLWAAECLKERSDTISSGWGCIGVLCNPASRLPADLESEWAKHVNGRSDPDQDRCDALAQESARVGSGKKNGQGTSGLTVSSIYGWALGCPVPGLEPIDL